MTILDEIKTSFRTGNTLIKLIYINVGVFILVHILEMLLYLGTGGNNIDSIIAWLGLPATINNFKYVPWSIITYMFLHEGFIHILFNMLWLFWFGRIFLQYLSERQLLTVYLLGGISGGVLYMLSYNAFPVFQSVREHSLALGASASVMAIVIAVAAYLPNMKIQLAFVGGIKLKHLGLIALFLTSIIDFSVNTGGKIAHIGGAIFGYFYIFQLRKNRDWSKSLDGIYNWFENLFKPKPKMKVGHKKNVTDQEWNKQKSDEQAELDRILEKLSKSGYNSLSKDEKDKLFTASKK